MAECGSVLKADFIFLAATVSCTAQCYLSQCFSLCSIPFPQHNILSINSRYSIPQPLTAGLWVAGAVGALAGFQAVQGSSEAQLLRLLANRATAILEAAKRLNWLPDQPPRTALGHTAYIQDLLPFLKVQIIDKGSSLWHTPFYARRFPVMYTKYATASAAYDVRALRCLQRTNATFAVLDGLVRMHKGEMHKQRAQLKVTRAVNVAETCLARRKI